MYEALAHHPHKMASGLSSLGRGKDSTLVHMSPAEVGGLHALAKATTGHGLTKNPLTGLPEAGILSSLLPMLAGGLATVLTGGALSPLEAGLIAGGTDTALTGDWKKGLMAGIGAYGGANLTSGLGALGDQTAAAQTAATNAAVSSQENALGAINSDVATKAGDQAANSLSSDASLGARAAAGNDAYLSSLSSNMPSQIGALNPVINAPTFQGGIQGGIQAIQDNPMKGLSALGSNMGKFGIAAAASPILGVASAAQQKNIPAAKNTSPEYYNTKYDPRTMRYSPGNWSTVYGGPGYTGAAGAGQVANSSGPLGSYADPYTAVTAVKSGGGIKAMAAGGSTSSSSDGSALSNYYNGLINGSVSTSQLIPSDPAASNDYLSSLSALNPAANMPNHSWNEPWIPGYNSNIANYGGLSSLPVTSQTQVPASSINPTGGISSLPYKDPTAKYGNYGKFAGGGLTNYGTHLGSYSDGGRLLKGPGDGMSDSIPAVIHGQKPVPAALADGEFVIPADVVSHLGNGSTDAGSKMLYKMLDKVRAARTGNSNQGKQINPDKFLPA